MKKDNANYTNLGILKELEYMPNVPNCNIRSEELRKELLKWYHRSDGNKHKFIREFLSMTEVEIEELKQTPKKKGCGNYFVYKGKGFICEHDLCPECQKENKK